MSTSSYSPDITKSRTEGEVAYNVRARRVSSSALGKMLDLVAVLLLPYTRLVCFILRYSYSYHFQACWLDFYFLFRSCIFNITSGICSSRVDEMGSYQFLQMLVAQLHFRLYFLSVFEYIGICFQSSYAILPLNIPDNPSQPCLSCTKQWCLNQNLPICAGASLGNTNPDTATGKEGDVEARCFRKVSFQNVAPQG